MAETITQISQLTVNNKLYNLKDNISGYITANSPNLTGTPTAPTPGDNATGTQIATVAYVNSHSSTGTVNDTFKTITVTPVSGGTPVSVIANGEDTLKFSAGDNVNLTLNQATKEITINSTGGGGSGGVGNLGIQYESAQGDTVGELNFITTNAGLGTVTQISTGTGLTGGPITSTGTISLANNYGDTKNPYAGKTKNYVLAAPSNANGIPGFRLLDATDIPTLTVSKISDFPSWANTSTKPTYTASEVGAATSGHTHGISLNSTTSTSGVVQLAHSGTYNLTAGGSTVTFKLPPAEGSGGGGSGSGTITGVTAGSGLSGGGTAGSVTINHSNSVTAQSTQAVYPITIDAQGHIVTYGSPYYGAQIIRW